jgi:hypothetical protein
MAGDQEIALTPIAWAGKVSISEDPSSARGVLSEVISNREYLEREGERERERESHLGLETRSLTVELQHRDLSITRSASEDRTEFIRSPRDRVDCHRRPYS